MAKRAKAPATPATTAQRLASLVKTCRDIMRKDKGLNGDLDRLPQLTWIMFLKFLDDLEQQDESKAKLAGERYSPLIPAPYRWRDWAAKPDGITGPELLAFVNQDEAVLPNGKRGPGLFATLKRLSGSDGVDRRGVIARVFEGTTNRMIQGYLLRDVINKINELHFSSSDELHTLGALYEGMLREMRDAAGDSGEFYTPRPVVRFMVAVTDPRLGETVLDPACGTGGFLVEAHEHLKGQVKTTKDRQLLQRRTLFGGEAKPLPYLLAEMNLLLHGVEIPNIEYGNSLGVKLGEIGDKDRVDAILTNPPFGGEEEAAIKGNFPSDLQTAATEQLFLQLIMRKLRRPGHNGKPGRAAVVVPNGTLFGDGVCARIKAQLLKEFNLHTIVRLPNGVFAPYTSIPTNLLFFDRSGPTKDIWYYEHPLPEGRRQYTKTQPLQFEEFAPCLAWWRDRRQNDRAWRMSASELLADNSCNLDRKNPSGTADPEQLQPATLVGRILKTERRIAEILVGGREEAPESIQDAISLFVESIDAQHRGEGPRLADSAGGGQRGIARVHELMTRASELRTLQRQIDNSVLALPAAVARYVFDRLALRHATRRLSDLVVMKGGGTPSKANALFWDGDIPWISPKDMKVRQLVDSADHITEDATTGSAAKVIDSGAVLIVVRGMILAHTFPAAVLRVPAAINQDMKALVPRAGLLPEFLCAFLWVRNRDVLNLVERSTHDTRRLDARRVLDLKLPLPPIPEQRLVVSWLDAVEGSVSARHLGSGTVPA